LNKLKRTECGWAGHFCCASRCLFRRNTLLEYDKIKIVVSSVGLMSMGKFVMDDYETIGLDRYYETMAFHSKEDDDKYHDADVHRRISFDSPWAIDKFNTEDKANDMHETVVSEISRKLRKRKTFES